MRENDPRSSPHAEDEKRPIERELADLRREVLESRNLVIKTDNLLKNLFAELKAVSKKNEDQYRRTWYASAAAYLVFLGMAIALALVGARASVSGEKARVDSAQAEADLSKKRSDDLAAQLAKVQKDGELAAQARKGAGDVYRLLTEGDAEGRLRGVDELARLDRTRLDALELKALDDRARTLKVELGQAAFERGTKAHKREDWKAAAAELKRYLALDPDGGEALQASFLAGTALFNLKDWAGALPHLERFTKGGKGLKNVDYAFFLLGQAEESLGHFDKAMEAYKRGTSDYPGSEYVPAMQQRFRVAQRSATAGQPAPETPAPAAAQPAAPTPTSAPAPAPTTPIPAQPAPKTAAPTAAAPQPAAAPLQPAPAPVKPAQAAPKPADHP